jgi:hypothetical protein
VTPLYLTERLIPVLWPIGKRGGKTVQSWFTACTLLVIPVTAISHHLLFQPHGCMLQNHGQDYNLQSVRHLFLHDPSLPWAIAAMVLLYHLGKKSSVLRTAAFPAFTASLPISLWLWDIPFSRRMICRHFHDGRMGLGRGFLTDTRLVYGFCLLLYLAFQAILFFKRRRTRMA